MTKNNFTTVSLAKGEVRKYDFGDTKLYSYKTNDLIDDEAFIIAKNGKGIAVEQPCFYDNIKELTEYLTKENITVEGKLIAYHAGGASFLPSVTVYGTESSEKYNTVGGGAGLVSNFKNAFGDSFDSGISNADKILEDGETEIAGIKLKITSNAEAYDIEFPEINCVYTHMMGHDCHSIVAGCPHADAIISQLNYYIRKGFALVLTSHYTPEDLKDARIKADYLKDLKEISAECESAAEMKARVKDKYPLYGGENYLDMTVGFFFPQG